VAYTRHGHHIPGTPKTGVIPLRVRNCGGVRKCVSCTTEAENAKKI